MSIKYGKILKIRSGGQTGVDRAALDVAKAYEIPVCGWCPKGGWAEDFSVPPGVLDKYPELKETPLQRVEQRTVWNVRDSDATLIINPQGADCSKGTLLTENAARIFKKPCFELKSEKKVSDVIFWLDSLGSNLIINVAGPRESECKEAYDMTAKILGLIIEEINA